MFPRSHNIVGRWCPSAGATGFRLLDRVGSNHGTLTNMDATSDWVPSGGKLALDFDGSNDSVRFIGSLSSFAYIQNTMRFSFSFWVQLANTTTRYVFFGNAVTTSQKGFFLIFENNAGFGTRAVRFVSFFGGGTTAQFRSADNAISDTAWHHLTVTADGSSPTGQVFVDGSAVSTTSQTSGALSTGDSTHQLALGALPPSFILPIGAQLDDIVFYDAPLTANEVREVYILGRGYGVYPDFDFDEANILAPSIANPVLFHNHYVNQGFY